MEIFTHYIYEEGADAKQECRDEDMEYYLAIDMFTLIVLKYPLFLNDEVEPGIG